MNYLEWNNCFGDYFFSPKNHDKIMSLFTTEDEIYEIGLQSGTFQTDINRDSIIEDFKKAFQTGIPRSITQANAIRNDIVDQMLYECHHSQSFYQIKKDDFDCAGVNVRYPAYLLHVLGT